jgi:ATP-dependent Clp protease protease subunit
MRASRKQHSAEEHSFALGHGIDPETRTIYLVGQIDDEMLFRFTVGFRMLDSSKGPIRIVLNSPGGSETAGFAIYDVLLMARNEVAIDGYGSVQSIAALVLQGADRRRLSPECRFMVHNGTLEFTGPVYQGTVTAIADESKFLTTRYRELLARASKQSIATISDWCDSERYFSAREAIAAGFADVLITPSTVELPKAKKSRAKPADGEVLIEVDPSTIQKLLTPAKRKRRRLSAT